MIQATLDRIKDHVVWTIIGAALALVGPTIVTTVTDSVHDRLAMPMYQQRVVWIRKAASEVPCGVGLLPYAPVLNEVVYWNLRIVHEQEARRHWWTKGLTSSKWDSFQSIPLPCSRQ